VVIDPQITQISADLEFHSADTEKASAEICEICG